MEASLGFCAFVWGTNFVVIKAALPAMPSHVLNLFRMLSALVVLGVLYIVRTRRSRTPVFAALKDDPRRLIATGLLGYVLYQVAFIVGLDHTLAGSAALIMASAPVWTAVLARLLGIEHFGAASWAGLALSLTGVLFIVLLGGKEIDLSLAALFGNVVMVAAAMMWAAYSVLNRPLLASVSPLALTFYGVLLSILPLAGVAAPYVGQVRWAEVTPWIWVAIAFSGAFSTGITVVLWNDGIRQIGPSRTAVFSYLVPVIALATGVAFLGEPLQAGQVLGGALVITGLAVVRRFGRRRDAAGGPPGAGAGAGAGAVAVRN